MNNASAQATHQQVLAPVVLDVRDLRIEFLLKLAFLQRDGRPLIHTIRQQRAALDPTIAALVEADTDDNVELWRKHNAEAASAYLADLESRYG